MGFSWITPLMVQVGSLISLHIIAVDVAKKLRAFITRKGL